MAYRYVISASSTGSSRTFRQSTRTIAGGATWTVSAVVLPMCQSSPCRLEVSLPGHPETIDFLVNPAPPGGGLRVASHQHPWPARSLPYPKSNTAEGTVISTAQYRGGGDISDGCGDAPRRGTDEGCQRLISSCCGNSLSGPDLAASLIGNVRAGACKDQHPPARRYPHS